MAPKGNEGGGEGTHVMHGGSCVTIGPRFPTMLERKTRERDGGGGGRDSSIGNAAEERKKEIADRVAKFQFAYI